MTVSVDAAVAALTDSAIKARREQRTRPRVKKLLNALAGKSKIIVTSHLHPDPDALGSAQAMAVLLTTLLPEVKVRVCLRGQVGGGLNAGFTRVSGLQYECWDERHDPDEAIVLVDTQPGFANSPLPPGLFPTAIIDHHRGRGRRAKVPFADIRINVGATASILFSYFMEANVPISATLAASMLYAIETDLSGIAGTQGGLDTLAISSLVLLADTKRLYQMRYVDLPPVYYAAFAESVKHATSYDDLIISYLDKADYAEMPGVMADFLLRCRGVTWTMMTAIHDGRLAFSIRTSAHDRSAGEVARRISDGMGDGGGHLTKAGGAIPLKTGTAREVSTIRARLGKRLLRCLEIPSNRGSKLA